MPELPEVETVRRGLEPAMAGQIIACVDVRRPDLRWPFPKDMAARLSGQKVLRLRRRAKYILVDLASGETLIIHLGMSGRMLIDGPADNFPEPAKHDHVIFYLKTGKRVVFNDTRRFGAMDLCQTDRLEDHKLLANLGPEPLGNRFDENYLKSSFSTRKTPVKSALLDQKTVAGLGNIYVCEALWRSGISPLKPVLKLSQSKIGTLVPMIRLVLTEAIESGGSSLRDHLQTNGEMGYFQHSFAVYGREGEPCLTPDCKGKIVRIVQSGRSTFYCPRCQR